MNACKPALQQKAEEAQSAQLNKQKVKEPGP